MLAGPEIHFNSRERTRNERRKKKIIFRDPSALTTTTKLPRDFGSKEFLKYNIPGLDSMKLDFVIVVGESGIGKSTALQWYRNDLLIQGMPSVFVRDLHANLKNLIRANE